MTISSLEYKKALNDFDDDLGDVLDALENAVEGELDAEELKVAIQGAKGKLIAYDRLIARADLSDLKRKQVAERYEEALSDIKSCLEKLEGDAQ